MKKLLIVTFIDTVPEWAMTDLPTGIYFNPPSQNIYFYARKHEVPYVCWDDMSGMPANRMINLAAQFAKMLHDKEMPAHHCIEYPCGVYSRLRNSVYDLINTVLSEETEWRMVDFARKENVNKVSVEKLYQDKYLNKWFKVSIDKQSIVLPYFDGKGSSSIKFKNGQMIQPLPYDEIEKLFKCQTICEMRIPCEFYLPATFFDEHCTEEEFTRQ